MLGGDVGARISRADVRRDGSQIDDDTACFATLGIRTADDSRLLLFHGGGFGTNGEVRALYIDLQYALEIGDGTLCDVGARAVCDLGVWVFSIDQEEAEEGAREERIDPAD